MDVGKEVGTTDGTAVGIDDGDIVGDDVGEAEGTDVGMDLFVKINGRGVNMRR